MKYLPVLILLISSPVFSQVTIVNHNNLDFPKEKVNIIFRMACKVVADEFHVRGGASKKEFPLTLVLGSRDERYTEDEERQVYTIYLDHWNEVQFAASSMRLAIQRMVPRSRRDKMLLEILRRSNQVAPVPVTTLASGPQ